MSSSDRSEQLALVAFACTLIVYTIGLLAGGYYYGQYRSYKQYEAGIEIPTTDLGGFWLKHPPVTGSYEAICDHPSDKDQADLCQQWRSANAAEAVSEYSLLGLCLSFLGIGGLVWTITISNKATKAATEATLAAVDSAKAADAANKLAARASAIDQRPWLSLVLTSMKQDFTTNQIGSFTFNLETTNHGKTPAFDAFFHYRIVRGLRTGMEVVYADFVRQKLTEHIDPDRKRQAIVFPGGPNAIGPVSTTEEAGFIGGDGIAKHYYLLACVIYGSPTIEGLAHSGIVYHIEVANFGVVASYVAGTEGAKFNLMGIASAT